MDMVCSFGVYLGPLRNDFSRVELQRKSERATDNVCLRRKRHCRAILALVKGCGIIGCDCGFYVATFACGSLFLFLSFRSIHQSNNLNLFPTNTSKQQIQLPSTLALPFLFPPPLYSLHFLMPCFHPKKKSILSIHRTHFRPFSYLAV